ncbi:hypothetical protein JCM9279_004647 [Rhodotorula babjevae]
MASLEGVPPPAPPPAPDQPAPLAVTRDFRPYYSPVELDYLVHLQAHARHSAHAHQTTALSDHRIEHYRQLACGFIERVAARLGFPRRTIATAQKLYHRFHLHFSLTDFAYQDVSLATLLVASKLEDTLKKLREIQIAAYQVSNLLEGGNGIGEGDPVAQEAHRPHLIGIERLVLQTISFNFNLHRSLDPVDADAPNDGNSDALLLAAALATPPPTRDAFTYLVRLAHSLPSLPPLLLALPAPSPPGTSPAPAPPTPDTVLKQLTFAAFLLLTDLHRTLAPLLYPPHTCAAACVYLAGFMLVAAARRGASGAGGGPSAGAGSGEEGAGVWDAEVVRDWARSCESDERDIDDIAQMLLDLLIYLCPSSASTSTSSLTATSTVSPLFSPSSASPSDSAPALSDRDKHLVATGVPNSFAAHPLLGPRASVDALMRVKIDLRRAREAHGPSASSSSSSAARGTKRRRLSTDAFALPGAADDVKDEPPLEPEPDTPLSRAQRWANLAAGLADVGRVRDERVLKELVRAEERAERERAAAGPVVGGAGAGPGQGPEGGAAGAGGVGGAGGATADGRTEEEREKERRDRRERLRPGSVRYRF